MSFPETGIDLRTGSKQIKFQIQAGTGMSENRQRTGKRGGRDSNGAGSLRTMESNLAENSGKTAKPRGKAFRKGESGIPGYLAQLRQRGLDGRQCFQIPRTGAL